MESLRIRGGPPATCHASAADCAAANGVLAFVIVYVVLLGLVGAGTALDPLSSATSIQPSAVTAMQMLLAQNPQVAGFVPSGELRQLAAVS
jgi:hypothetical protein